MDLIEQLVSCSESLLEVLQHSADERDKQVEEVEQLLAEREKIIARLKQGSYENLHQHPQARKIVEMEQDIQKGLRRLYEDIKMDLKRWNEKKRLQQSYENTFSYVETYDGRFYDKRK
ncbi:flagellar protein FliT [Parageobacillus thermoglucosidasius]|uniref:Flagellar protein FliT n=1 Tax=Parageobacillus thermoglucosidasius TaxID=1426 RepID=A0AB38QXA7_PARTM|nr:flagellar protein FliT [Parageobacillus thermoglucosidasius]UOE76048.1 flagellar protein FliT [Parageobacillus thermoglucosidasius]